MRLDQLDNRLTPEQVATTLSVRVETIYNWHKAGRYAEELPIHKGKNKRLFCFREDVERFAVDWFGLSNKPKAAS